MTLLTIGTAYSVPAHYAIEEISVGSNTHQYALLLPEQRGEKSSVVLFLHGAGERGNDLNLATSKGIASLRKSIPDAIVVVPQVRPGGWWSDPEYLLLAMASLEHTIKKFNADTNRLYLTGLSMGGHGALHLAAMYPDHFAAVIAVCPRLGRPAFLEPVAGLFSADELAERLSALPVWLFHGSKDEIVPVENSRKLSQKLLGRRAPARYTEFEHAMHNIWDRAYSHAQLSHWLRSQTKSSSLPPAAGNE